MKNKNKSGKNDHELSGKDNKKNFWKIIAISVIILFAVLVIGGAIKAHYIRSSFTKPTSDQIGVASKAASKMLQSTGANMSAFMMQAGGKMRMMRDSNVKGSIIQVSFYNNATTHMYLVNVDSGEVLLHSQTDIYRQLEDKKPRMDRDDMWFPMGFYGDGR